MAETFHTEINKYTQLITNEPANGMHYFYRGHWHQRGSDYKKALSDYTNAIDCELEGKYLAYAERGYVYLLMGDFQAAEVDLDQALQLNSTSKTALRYRSELYLLQYNMPQALLKITLAASSSKDSVSSLFMLAQYHLANNAIHTAREYYIKIFNLLDQQIDAEEGLDEFDLMMRAQGLIDVAIMHKRPPTVNYAKADKCLQNAYRDIESALKMNPSNILLLKTKATVLFIDGQHKQALELLDELIDQHPTFIYAQMLKAQIHEQIAVQGQQIVDHIRLAECRIVYERGHIALKPAKPDRADDRLELLSQPDNLEAAAPLRNDKAWDGESFEKYWADHFENTNAVAFDIFADDAFIGFAVIDDVDMRQSHAHLLVVLDHQNITDEARTEVFLTLINICQGQLKLQDVSFAVTDANATVGSWLQEKYQLEPIEAENSVYFVIEQKQQAAPSVSDEQQLMVNKNNKPSRFNWRSPGAVFSAAALLTFGTFAVVKYKDELGQAGDLIRDSFTKK